MKIKTRRDPDERSPLQSLRHTPMDFRTASRTRTGSARERPSPCVRFHIETSRLTNAVDRSNTLHLCCTSSAGIYSSEGPSTSPSSQSSRPFHRLSESVSLLWTCKRDTCTPVLRNRNIDRWMRRIRLADRCRRSIAVWDLWENEVQREERRIDELDLVFGLGHLSMNVVVLESSLIGDLNELFRRFIVLGHLIIVKMFLVFQRLNHRTGSTNDRPMNFSDSPSERPTDRRRIFDTNWKFDRRPSRWTRWNRPPRCRESSEQIRPTDQQKTSFRFVLLELRRRWNHSLFPCPIRNACVIRQWKLYAKKELKVRWQTPFALTESPGWCPSRQRFRAFVDHERRILVEHVLLFIEQKRKAWKWTECWLLPCHHCWCFSFAAVSGSSACFFASAATRKRSGSETMRTQPSFSFSSTRSFSVELFNSSKRF